MPNIDNTLLGYAGGEYFYEVPEWAAIATGHECEYITKDATTFVPDWKVDEDPRLVCSYVGTAENRDNDREAAYLSDKLTAKSGIVVPEDKVYTDLYGYDLVPGTGHIVRCWYCREEFSYRECESQRRTERQNMEAFVTEMLLHYSEHRAGTTVPGAADLPYVTTYFPGRTILRPNGTVAATKPGVVRTWQIKGALLGSYA